jgi:phosphate transport system substrate-binding protein
MQLPTVIGGVEIIGKIPGIKPNQLKLTGSILADIYLGKITKWNDKAITAINPDLKVPSLVIAPVRRADGSGTTFVFTDYLSIQSLQWKSKVSSGTSLSCPVGSGARGSDGIAATVRQIKSGIGYVESAHADQNSLTTALLLNKTGRFVAPKFAAFEDAAANADWLNVEHLAIGLNIQPGAESWPIASATFVLLPANPQNVNRSAGVKKFFARGRHAWQRDRRAAA